MYDRICLTTFKDGSASLPSILKFNQKPEYYTITNNAAITESGRILKTYGGNIGNNQNEFSADFYLSSAFGTTDLSPSVKKLYDYIEQDTFVAVSKNFIIENFNVWEIPDYSSQAMGIRDYDFFAKAFTDNNSSSSEYYTLNNKIASSATVVLKSYTLKCAWVLTDKKTTKPSTLVIDFIYKITNLEKNGTLKYSINTDKNLMGLLCDPKNCSPCYDKVYFNKNAENLIKDKQGDYFSYTLSNIFNHKRDATNLDDRDTEDQISSKLDNTLFNWTLYAEDSRNDKNLLDTSKYDFKILQGSDALSATRSVSREIWGRNKLGKDMSKSDDFICTRCFNESNTISKTYCEEFPYLADMIHYMYKYVETPTADNTDTDNADAVAENTTPVVTDESAEDESGKTETEPTMHDKLYAKLKGDGLYLYNYNFKVYYFTLNTDKYVEVLIPFNTRGYIIYTKTPTINADTGTNIFDKALTYSDDRRSVNDPTSQYQAPYAGDVYTIARIISENDSTDNFLANKWIVCNTDDIYVGCNDYYPYNTMFDLVKHTTSGNCTITARKIDSTRILNTLQNSLKMLATHPTGEEKKYSDITNTLLEEEFNLEIFVFGNIFVKMFNNNQLIYEDCLDTSPQTTVSIIRGSKYKMFYNTHKYLYFCILCDKSSSDCSGYIKSSDKVMYFSKFRSVGTFNDKSAYLFLTDDTSGIYIKCADDSATFTGYGMYI